MSDLEIYNEIMDGFRGAAKAKDLAMLNKAFAAHREKLDEWSKTNQARYNFLRASYRYHKTLITGDCWDYCKNNRKAAEDCSRKCKKKEEKKGG